MKRYKQFFCLNRNIKYWIWVLIIFFSSVLSCTENPLRYIRHAASSQAVKRRRGSVGLRVSAVWQRWPAEGALQPHAASRWRQQGQNPRDQDIEELKGYILSPKRRRLHQRGEQEERKRPAAGAAETEQQTGRGGVRWQNPFFLQRAQLETDTKRHGYQADILL